MQIDLQSSEEIKDEEKESPPQSNGTIPRLCCLSLPIIGFILIFSIYIFLLVFYHEKINDEDIDQRIVAILLFWPIPFMLITYVSVSTCHFICQSLSVSDLTDIKNEYTENHKEVELEDTDFSETELDTKIYGEV